MYGRWGGGGGGGVVKDTAEWELVSGRRAYAKVVQQARVEVVNRFAVLSGGEKVREETCVIGDSIVRRGCGYGRLYCQGFYR